jgi:hypothetical protein
MLGLACPRRRPRVPRMQLSAGAKHRQRRNTRQRRIQIDPIRIGTLDQIDLLRGPPPPPDALFQWRASSTTDLDRPLRSRRGRRWPIQAADASPSPLFTTKAKPLSQGRQQHRIRVGTSTEATTLAIDSPDSTGTSPRITPAAPAECTRETAIVVALSAGAPHQSAGQVERYFLRPKRVVQRR